MRKLANVILWNAAGALVAALPAFADEEKLEYQWSSMAYKRELLLQIRALVVIAILFIGVKLAGRLIARRRVA